MNEAYAPMGFTFEVGNIDFAANDELAAVAPWTDEEVTMKSIFKKGSYGDLNLYFMSDLDKGMEGLMGM